MFKNTAAKFMVFAFDTTTNAPKTGDAANITAYVSRDYGAVTVLGDTTATEMDATNAPGYYLFDAAQAETNADVLMISGKSSTANIKVIGAPAVIFTRPATGWLAPATAGRTLNVGASGHALADLDTIKTQTITCAAGVTVLASVGTAATSTAQTGDAFARLGAPAGASVSADVAALKADTAAILVDTGTDGVVVAAGSKTGYSLTANTGLGNQTADITGTISTVTSVTNEVTANVTKISGSAAAADALEESTEAIAYGTVDGTGATTTVFLSSALTPDSAANDQFLGRVLIFKSDTTTANLRGQATTITDYAHTSAEVGTFTVTALTTAPSTGDTFVIL